MPPLVPFFNVLFEIGIFNVLEVENDKEWERKLWYYFKIRFSLFIRLFKIRHRFINANRVDADAVSIFHEPVNRTEGIRFAFAIS